MTTHIATQDAENTPTAHPGRVQPLLPFGESELLRVRVRPAEFARMMSVDKSTVTRWVQKSHIALGADGRLDPNAAMRQLLRHGDPGQIRARLVRQAFADLNDLRAEASRASDLNRQLLDLQARHAMERARDEIDYLQIDEWLAAFETRVGAIPQETRASLDALAWRSHVKSLLLEIMQAGDDLAEIDRQVVASLSLAMPCAGKPPPAVEEAEGEA